MGAGHVGGVAQSMEGAGRLKHLDGHDLPSPGDPLHPSDGAIAVDVPGGLKSVGRVGRAVVG